MRRTLYSGAHLRALPDATLDAFMGETATPEEPASAAEVVVISFQEIHLTCQCGRKHRVVVENGRVRQEVEE